MFLIAIGIIVHALVGHVSGQQCTTNNPVASMCYSQHVSGSNVTLDVSMAAQTGAESCSCNVTSDVTGMKFVFDKFPRQSDCNSYLRIEMGSTILQTRCYYFDSGPHSVDRNTATVQLLQPSASGNDSSYCLSFFTDTVGSTINITCGSAIYPTTTTSVTTSTADHVTTDTPSETPPNVTETPTQADVPNVTGTILTTQLQNTTSTISGADSTTSSLSTMPPSNASTAPPQSKSTSTPSSSTSSTSTLSSVITSAFTTDSPRNSSTTNSFTNKSTSNVLTTIVSTHEENVTTTAQETNTTASTTDMLTTTTHPDKSSTTQVSKTTDGDSGNVSNATTPSSSITPDTRNSSVTEFSTSTTEPVTPTSSDRTVAKSTPTILTTVHDSGNYTNVTSTLSTDTSFATTTVSPNVSSSTTSFSNSSTIPMTSSSTTTESTYSSNVSTQITTISSNVSFTTDVPNSNITTTTAYFGNDTTNEWNVTTEGPDNTTEVVNVTTKVPDNTTEEMNVTTSRTTTRNWDWDLPDPQDYSAAKKTNIVIVIVPLIAVMLLIIIAGATFIICKRSRKASRQTKLPKDEEKAPPSGKKEDITNTFVTSSTTGNDRQSVANKANSGDHYQKVALGNGAKSDANCVDESSNNKNKHGHSQKGPINRDNAKYIGDHEPNQFTKSVASKSGAPKVYEPTEREKGLLQSLELSTIVVDADPGDPNRYFLKTDPVDWYRIIMKGKQPNGDSSKKGKHKKGKKDGDHKKRHTKDKYTKQKDRKTDSDCEVSRDSSSKRHTPDTSKYGHKDGTNSMKGKDSLKDKTNGMVEDKPTSSVQPRLVASKPVNKDVTAGLKEVTGNAKTTPVQPKLVVSKPINARGPKTDATISDTKAAVTSQPKLIVSKPTEPVANTSQSRLVVSRPLTDTADSTNQTTVKSPPQRSANFGNRSSGFRQSLSEKDAPKVATVKRPENVPPLDLTVSGDGVERDDDGFEGFVLVA